MPVSFDCATPILATTTQVMRADATPNAPTANRRTLELLPDQYGERPVSLNGAYPRHLVIVRGDDEILSEWAALGGPLGEAAAEHLALLMAAEQRRLDALAALGAAPPLPEATRDRMATRAAQDAYSREYEAAAKELARREAAVAAAQDELHKMENARAFLIRWSEQGAGRSQWNDRYVTAYTEGVSAGLDLPPQVSWAGAEMEAALEAAFPGAQWRVAEMAYWRVVLANGRTLGWFNRDPNTALADAVTYWSKGQEWLAHLAKTGRIVGSDWNGEPLGTGKTPSVKHAAELAGLTEKEVIAACAGMSVEEVIASGKGYGVLEHVATYGRCPSGPVGPYYHWARKAA